MSVAVKERKRGNQTDEPSVSDATLAKLGMKDCTPGAFKSRAMELHDLESLYRLKHVAYDTFLSDSHTLSGVMRIIDQRIDSM